VTRRSHFGSPTDAPSAGSTVKIETLSLPAQATFIASPRMTPVSWQEWCSVAGVPAAPVAASFRIDAADGLARGSSMMSIPRQEIGATAGSGCPKIVLADDLL
jgi:hypothetical protein